MVTQSKSHGPGSKITDFNAQHALIFVDSDEREVILDPKDPISMSLSTDLPAAEPSMLPQLSSRWPLKFPLSSLKNRQTS